MKNEKGLLDFLIQNSGLPENLTWYEIGKQFNIQPPDLERALSDSKYEKDAIKKAAFHIWKKYLSKSLDSVELVVTEDGTEVRKVQPKRLFFDIETSYNIVKGVWRTGYNLSVQPEQIIRERAIICVSYSWEGNDEIHTIYWNDGDDRELIKEFIPILESADEIIGHNIDKFDIKWVRTRALYHSIPMSFNIKTTDTLKLVKKYFYLNSNKLDYVATIVGVENKLSHRGISMWDDIILRNDKNALKEMGEYCEKDIVVTKAVYYKVKPYSQHTVHHSALKTGDKYSCPECGSKEIKLVKTTVTKLGTLKKEVECTLCTTSFMLSESNYKKFTIIDTL